MKYVLKIFSPTRQVYFPSSVFSLGGKFPSFLCPVCFHSLSLSLVFLTTVLAWLLWEVIFLIGPGLLLCKLTYTWSLLIIKNRMEKIYTIVHDLSEGRKKWQ
jgi:hypothetical protein